MDRSKYQELKNKAFNAQTEEAWNNVMKVINSETSNDMRARKSLEEYCNSLIDKKKEWWKKNNKAQPVSDHNVTTIFSPETDKAIGDLATMLTKYLAKKYLTE